MANICDGYMHDKEGNLYRPHSNSKTSDYSSEKTSVDNTSDALDELYEKVENANSGIELTYAEYLALSEEEKSNGTTYYVKDYPVSANGEIPNATSEIDGLMAKEDKIKLDSLILVNGVIDSSNLPSYVDDIIEGYYSDGVFYEDSECTIKIKGESGKIYVDLTEEDKPKTYRWSGSIYVEISSGSSSTAGSKDSDSKLFLIGSTEQQESSETFSQDTAYVGNDGHLYSDDKQVVNVSGEQALLNKTYEGYTLGSACEKDVTDSETASAISTGNNLVTERDVYHGLPNINGSHGYTSNTKIYAPTSVGTSGYVLKSNGSGAPSWVNPTSLATATYSTTDLTAGTSPLATGTLYCVYE